MRLNVHWMIEQVTHIIYDRYARLTLVGCPAHNEYVRYARVIHIDISLSRLDDTYHTPTTPTHIEIYLGKSRFAKSHVTFDPTATTSINMITDRNYHPAMRALGRHHVRVEIIMASCSCRYNNHKRMCASRQGWTGREYVMRWACYNHYIHSLA